MGAGGAKGTVELGDGDGVGEVRATLDVVGVFGVAEDWMAVVEAVRLEVKAEEASRVALPSVIITLSDWDRVIEPSKGPSSPHANGKAAFNVAMLQADEEDFEDAEDDDIVPLSLVVGEVAETVSEELVMLVAVDGTSEA